MPHFEGFVCDWITLSKFLDQAGVFYGPKGLREDLGRAAKPMIAIVSGNGLISPFEI